MADVKLGHENRGYAGSKADLERERTALELKTSPPAIEPRDTVVNGVSGLDAEETEESDESNICMETVGKLQKLLSGVYKEHRRSIAAGLLVVATLGFVAFLFAGLIINFNRALPLLIIALVIAISLGYYYLLKPQLIIVLEKPWKKFVFILQEIWSKRYVKWSFYATVIVAIIVFLAVDTRDNLLRLVSFVGLLSFVGISFVLSRNPSKISWRPVLWGVALQSLFGLLILRWDVGSTVFDFLAEQVTNFLGYTHAGTSFVYGWLVDVPPICGLAPVFAFSVLPTVIFFSSTVSILYYFGVVQFFIKRLAGFMQLTMGTTAAESLAVSSNIFVGMTEAPLLIRPYLARLTLSEIFAIMTGGFATVAGSVFAVYVSFGACANHLLSASVMSAPASMALSKLFYPETKRSKTKTLKDLELEPSPEKNALEAASNGATSAIFLVANIIANLIAFLSFLAFFNAVIAWLGSMVNVDLSFEKLCSWLFYPLAFLMGPSWDHNEIMIVAELMGIKTFLNEFLAYKRLGEYINAGALSSRSQLIATYALCGFSNIGSIGVQIGGLGAMAPERRSDFAILAVRSMIAGSFACFMTACVVGVLTTDLGTCVLYPKLNSTCADLKLLSRLHVLSDNITLI